MNNLNEILEKVTDFLKSEAKTETVMGKEFQLGEFHCIPVLSVGLGFGGGSGEGKGKTADKSNAEGEGTGAGAVAGMGINPVGFLVSRGSEIQFIPSNAHKGLSAAFEKIPDLLDKYLEKTKQQEAGKV